MGIPNLKAIRDWCIGKFQPKGNYLTSVPEKYITRDELNNQNYTTMSAVEEKGYATMAEVEDKNYVTEGDIEGVPKIIYSISEPDTVQSGTIVAVYEE